MAEDRPKRIAIIAGHGGLDEAYPPLILATSAVAMEMEAAIFFTFYGLFIVHKERKNRLKVAPVGNAAMPVPVPNIIGILPGMTNMATGMMKNWMKKANTASIDDLLEMCIEFDVRLISCQMSMDVMGIKKEDLIDGIETAGAASFLEYAMDADITLYM
ncbi:MAG: peroxiredoxin family protein [Chloroflexi bacterium]|nr:peroxiredoxin family protein [Chloroflexota bacterium]